MGADMTGGGIVGSGHDTGSSRTVRDRRNGLDGGIARQSSIVAGEGGGFDTSVAIDGRRDAGDNTRQDSPSSLNTGVGRHCGSLDQRREARGRRTREGGGHGSAVGANGNGSIEVGTLVHHLAESACCNVSWVGMGRAWNIPLYSFSVHHLEAH